MAIREYMAALDAGDPDGALAQLDEDLAFLLALPGGVVRGGSKADYAGYLAARQAPPDRRHVILRYARDGDVEFAYGVVTEGGRSTGAFQSSARVTPQGRIARYQSLFDPGFLLVDRAGDAVAAAAAAAAGDEAR